MKPGFRMIERPQIPRHLCNHRYRYELYRHRHDGFSYNRTELLSTLARVVEL